VVYEPILTFIRACGETSVAYAISLRGRVLVEHATLGILPPVLDVHGVIANELQLTETVVAVVRPRRRIDDKVLTGLGVHQLLGTFVRR